MGVVLMMRWNFGFSSGAGNTEIGSEEAYQHVDPPRTWWANILVYPLLVSGKESVLSNCSPRKDTSRTPSSYVDFGKLHWIAPTVAQTAAPGLRRLLGVGLGSGATSSDFRQSKFIDRLNLGLN